jgi:hypothetical protein
MLVADVEPDSVAMVVPKTAALENGVTAEHEFVAAGLPAALEVLGVIAFHQAIREEQAMRPIGAKTELPVVPESALTNDQVRGRKRGAAAVHFLEYAIFDHPVGPAQMNCAALSGIGGIAETQSPQVDMLSRHCRISERMEASVWARFKSPLALSHAKSSLLVASAKKVPGANWALSSTWRRR